MFSSSTETVNTSEGDNACEIYTTGSLDHSTISIISPCNSSTTFLTLEPLGPTQEPIGSNPSTAVYTAILLLSPGSRETDLISTVPS